MSNDKRNNDLSVEIAESEDDDIEIVEENKAVHIKVGEEVLAATATAVNAGIVRAEAYEAAMEEGEVEEAQEAIEDSVEQLPERSFAFEIKFAKKNVFQEYVHSVVEALDVALNADEGQSTKFEFSIGSTEEEHVESEESYFIRAFMIHGLGCAAAHCDLGVCEEAVDAPTESTQSNEREESPDLDLSSLFTIDTSGSKKLSTDCIPSYKRSVKEVLDEESTECKRKKQEKINECPRVRPASSCFNCGAANHSLRECSKPRNNARINRAKSAKKTERYHIDTEQRFGHIRPGEISDKLKTALGLRRGELPFFFYRMRNLGYPPGWLEEAKVVDSGIALFNSEGQAVLKSDDEGTQDSMEHKYDISKIISFPGYNMDPGPNFYDDYKHHNVSPMNRHQMKEEFIKDLGDNISKGYKRKKLKNLPATSITTGCENSVSVLDMADMEIEDVDPASEANVIFSRPPPPPEPESGDEVAPPPLPPSPPPASVSSSQDNSQISANTNSTSEERSQSPTLADLEIRKQKLLAELTCGKAESSVQETSETTTIKEVESNDVEIVSGTPDFKSNCTSFTSPSTSIANASKRSDAIKESHIGTPVLQFSPFDKLPAGENFKVGVSDVINFENLPDSTGKYEQMKSVIKKVRRVITKLQNEDDN